MKCLVCGHQAPCNHTKRTKGLTIRYRRCPHCRRTFRTFEEEVPLERQKKPPRSNTGTNT